MDDLGGKPTIFGNTHVHNIPPSLSNAKRAKSLTLLVNSFHRLGSTDEECCERTPNLRNEFCFLQSSKFQNSFFGTFLPTSFSLFEVPKLSKTFWGTFPISFLLVSESIDTYQCSVVIYESITAVTPLNRSTVHAFFQTQD